VDHHQHIFSLYSNNLDGHPGGIITDKEKPIGLGVVRCWMQEPQAAVLDDVADALVADAVLVRSFCDVDIGQGSSKLSDSLR
jgi:hypothetical protein